MGPRGFGLALGEPRLAKRLAEGRAVRLVTADTALEFMGEPPLGTQFLKDSRLRSRSPEPKEYKLGLEVTGDSSFATSLRNGLFPYLGTNDKVRRLMGANSNADERRAIGAATLHRSWFPPAYADKSRPQKAT